MNFLAPAFLAGLAALAVPVIIHLIHRERRTVVQFPSLMFLQRIPYRSVRRQKLRHLLLLLLRCIALALLVAAFARPFFAHKQPVGLATAGAREVVILLDNSASMGYGTRWTRALDAVRKAIDGLTGQDRGTIVLFSKDAAVISEPSSQKDRLRAAIAGAKLGSEGTSYAPALKIASQIAAVSTLPRKEVVLISDFQQVGWAKRDEIVMPPATKIVPIDLGADNSPDVAVTSVTTDRGASERTHVTVAARITNVGSAAKTIGATLEVGGRIVDSKRVALPASGAAQVAFTPIAVPTAPTRGTVRITHDSLAADDAMNFTIAPDEAVPVLLVEPASPRPNQSLFVSRALAIGDKPSFRIDERSIDALRPSDLDGRALVILDGVIPPAGPVGARLRALVTGGAGLVLVPGDERAERWPAEWRALVPVAVGDVVDRTSDAGATLSSIDFANPVFELFNTPSNGDFSTARFYRYRRLTARGDSGVIARFDDGLPAAVERNVGAGKLLVWASSLDSYWTNLPLQAVFLPFVHQLARNVGRYTDARLWYSAGDVLDLSRHGELTSPFITKQGGDTTADLILESPSRTRERVSAEGNPHLVTLREQGFYELRGRDTPAGSGRPIAVNVDAAEADLSHLDPQELVASLAANSRPDVAGAAVNAATPQDQERRQRMWWFLMLGALLLMAAETTMSNQLSRRSS